ncbi:MAG: cupin domain-containing protein [Ignavibacteriae bacterium HGW-Ignavibacteriae-3]|nr:MAG: cupin domain-containing protein [Ignavibacteriae bacterium HGW-Ignavibacteriae-3]
MTHITNEPADVNSPKELINGINYQDGSVVSKQIIKKPNGNITLFAFDKDESLTEHSSPYEAVVYMVDGEMEIKIGGNPYNVKAGELIIMPPNIPHGLKATRKSKMLLTMIK